MQSSEPTPLLVTLLRDVRDPRRVDALTVYPLETILLVVVAGTLAGLRGWTAFATFAEDRRDWLARFVDVSAGVPPAHVLRRVVRSLRPDAFEPVLRAWFDAVGARAAGAGATPRARAVQVGRGAVATDGKAARGAVARGRRTTPLHLVEVYATRLRVVLGVRAVAGAPAEGDGLRALLDLVALPGATLTGDANFCTRANTAAARRRGTHYVFALKGNRGRLFAAAVAALAGLTTARARRRVGATCWRGVARGHGRVERRTVTAVAAAAVGVATTGWTDLRTLVQVRRERTVGGRTSVETHVYVTDHAPDARRLAGWTRGHWGIENRLHWLLDVALGEDRCRVRDATAATILAIVRRLALQLLRADTTYAAGIELKAARANRSEAYLTHLLTQEIVLK